MRVCPAGLSSALLLATVLSAQEPLKDPAPPTVHELPPLAAPAAKPFAELTTAAKAKPLADDAQTSDWPSFLGPRRDAKVRESHLLQAWPKSGPKLLWSMTRGEGYASPVILGERLIYTHRRDDDIFIDCLHAETGQRFWRHSYATSYTPEYFGSGPCATPTIEGDRVWVHGIDGKLLCLDLPTGRTVWQRDLRNDFELQQQFFGVATSPLLLGQHLIINLGKRGGPTVAAFDKTTGRIIWGTGSKWGMSCASPIVAPLHGKQRLFVLTGGKSRPTKGGLMVIDPIAGTILSEFSFRSRTYQSVNGSCPVVVGSTVMLTSSYGTGTIGVSISEDGEAKQSWKTRKIGLEFANAIEVGGNIYMVNGIRDRGGAIVCIEPRKGTELGRTEINWSETVTMRGEERELDFGLGTGSLLHLGKDIFLCLTDNGHLLRLKCTPKAATVLDRVSLFHSGETWTPLVLSRGLLYVCQNQPEKIGTAPRRLLCLDLRQ
ncbi:MAG: outer membrane protein assembly factor BamB [Planctomycetota bacterium]|jgi:outer membrane protein assembly factor BamB